jgi:aminopeptidase N
VNSKDIENYITKESGKDLSKIFDQYLRTTMIPQLEYQDKKKYTLIRWTNIVPGFKMPVRLANGNWIYPTDSWTKTNPQKNFEVDKNFYITVKKS